MVVGLQLPHLSTYDPPLAGEGTLDPLGLAALADRLADEILPSVTARMYRIRFITAIAVCARVVEEFNDRIASECVTPAYLTFEWLLTEALARDRRLPREATLRAPGIEKARAVLSRNQHLDSLSYLKTPKVFGFHGVYKRLAVAMGIVNENLYLMERGDSLLRTWESEQGVTGFADALKGTKGGSFLASRSGRFAAPWRRRRSSPHRVPASGGNSPPHFAPIAQAAGKGSSCISGSRIRGSPCAGKPFCCCRNTIREGRNTRLCEPSESTLLRNSRCG